MTMLAAALRLAARGMAIFPCHARGKTPATARGLKEATTDVDKIEHWWLRRPDYNIAAATGPASNIFVADIDGVDAEAEIRKLEEQYGALPPTVESITARGRHIFFQWPDCDVRNSAGKIAPGIDIRGAGGYVLLPPSMHPSGRCYAWSVDSASAFAPAPDWLLEKITARNGGGNGHGVAVSGAPAVAWHALVRDGAEEGRRNDTAARLAGHLLRRRVDPFVTLEICRMWNATRCRPPLDDAELAAVVDSIAGKELERRGLIR